jgi:hypothetical protein
MSSRTLIALLIAGVLAIAGGWYFGIATIPIEQRSVDAGKLMFPDLAPKLKDATKIEVIHQGKPTTIALVNGQWGLTDRGGYQVQETKLRGMLTALTELRLVEPRTSDPAEFSRLGVEDPDAPGSNSNLLRILDAAGKPMVAVIVGHRRVRTQGNVPDQVYVRRPGDNQAWLAEGGLEVDSDPQLWLDRDIMNIDHSRIAKVVATHGAQTLQFVRNGDKLALTEPADHPKLDDYKLDDVDRALELLTFQEVKPAADAVGDEAGHAVFTTTDGLAVTATVFHAGKDLWARFAVTGADKTKAEADRLAARLTGWTYQIGSWKEKALVPTLDDLKAAPEKPAATAAPGSAPSGIPSAAASSAGVPSLATPSAGGAAPAPAAPAAPAKP